MSDQKLITWTEIEPGHQTAIFASEVPGVDIKLTVRQTSANPDNFNFTVHTLFERANGRKDNECIAYAFRPTMEAAKAAAERESQEIYRYKN